MLLPWGNDVSVYKNRSHAFLRGFRYPFFKVSDIRRFMRSKSLALLVLILLVLGLVVLLILVLILLVLVLILIVLILIVLVLVVLVLVVHMPVAAFSP